MGNVRPAPDWLTPAMTADVVRVVERMPAPAPLASLGLSDDELAVIERMARVHGIAPERMVGRILRTVMKGHAA